MTWVASARKLARRCESSALAARRLLAHQRHALVRSGA
jgi:hypothetical protein